METIVANKKRNYSQKINGRFGSDKCRVFGFRKVKWYWDVRLYLPLFILTIAFMIPAKQQEVPPPQVVYGPTEAEIAALADNEPLQDREMTFDEKNVAELARLADCVGGNRSDEVKKIIMWVAINRSEDRSHGYGQSLLGEIARPKQWQQYSSDAVYLESTYLLAAQVYKTWQSGGARPIYNDMLWFVLNKDGSITVRNQFETGRNRAEMTFGQ